MVGFGGGTTGFVETFAGVIPAADIHHGHTALIMFIGGAGILIVRGLHALLGNFDVHTSAVGEFSAGAFDYFFKFGLGAREFLLPK
jgi:hypothetical protein